MIIQNKIATSGAYIFKNAILFEYLKEKNLSTDLALMRHAQSMYNVQSQKYLKQNNIKHLTWDQICQISDFNLDINFNKKFIDCQLSPHGQTQCQQIKNQYKQKNLNYDLILVSPLKRALQTCKHSFSSFPIKKVVLPQLTQAFRYACDVSDPIQQKRQQFSQFDFSRFMENDNLWILDTQPRTTKYRILSIIQSKQLLAYQQVQEELVMMMYEGKIYETDYQLRLRIQKVKNIIRRYKQQGFRKIIVMSHHYMIQSLLAQGFRKNNQPIINFADQVPNAVLIETNLSQLLSIR